jgi:hypothetical protein
MKLFLTLFLSILSSITIFASESISFDMFLLGSKIGELKITRTLSDDGLETYALQSTAKAKILWIDKSQKTNYIVVYKNGVLISSDHSYIENTGNNTNCKIRYNNQAYDVQKNDKKYTLSAIPSWSVLKMYFNEPKNIGQVLYEVDASTSYVKNIDPNVYEFKSGDGNKNVYHYKNGKLIQVDVHVSLVSVKIVRVS